MIKTRVFRFEKSSDRSVLFKNFNKFFSKYCFLFIL